MKPFRSPSLLAFYFLVALLLVCGPTHGFQPTTTNRPARLIAPPLTADVQGTAIDTSTVPQSTLPLPVPVAVAIPKTMPEAVRVFFFTGDHGPLYVVVSLLACASWRLVLSPSLSLPDISLFFSMALVWSFQEHFLHQQVLHKMDWMGKEIHQGHHDKPYHHISIDPAPLLLGWLGIAHLIASCLFPLPLALTATLGYGMAGLFYEWAHYIVHTKVRFSKHTTSGKFWNRVKDNHIRHHQIDDRYWFAFSSPWMDDWFGTNPSVKEVQQRRRQEKLNNLQE